MRKILIVDDEPDIVLSINEGIQKHYKSYECLCTTKCQEALKITNNYTPDLVITDWEMPEMSGIELIRNIKQNQDLVDIPIIMLTGKKLTSTDLSLALRTGANDYIRKPVDEIELLARIESVLRQADYYKEKIAEKEKNARLLQENYELKIQELIQVSFQMEKRNKAILDIKKNFDEAMELLNYSGKELDKINRSFDSQLTPEEDWQKFMQLFDNINSEYLNRLMSKFPTLTLYEQKLIAYLRLGLDNRQIAEILGIAHDSVRISRSRLRKKLGLEEHVGLQEFLISL